MNRFVLIFVIVAMSGCVTIPLAQQLNCKGNKALDARNYQLAIDRYQASLIEAQKAEDRQYIAIAMYGLARANGYLCNFKKAEDWFLQSIAIRETLPGSSEAYLSQNILELARLYLSAREWDKATIQFKRAIPLVEELGVETMDPIGYANVLEGYLDALVSVGDNAEAAQIRKKIEQLRNNPSTRMAGFKMRPYPTNCAFNK